MNRLKHIRCLRIALMLSLVLLVLHTGCAFIPTPVRLLNKPHVADARPRQNLKVCIIVKDERPISIQKSNMCGVMRNLYMIPTSFAFLAHNEHLEQILAHHLAKDLEHLGYTVVASYPKAPSALSQRKIKAKTLDKDAKHQAWWKDSNSQYDSESKKKGLKGSVEDTGEETVSPWGPDVDVSKVDIVIEVKIRKFWSDMGWAIDVTGVFAWMSANVAVCDADDPVRRVLFGKKVRGFGHGRGVTPLEAYGLPLNAAYWFVLHGIEKLIASDEFRQSVSEARGIEPGYEDPR